MRRRTVLFLLALLAFITSSAQNLDGNSIALKATTSVSGDEFLINVQCKGDSIRLVYKVKDSTPRSWHRTLPTGA